MNRIKQALMRFFRADPTDYGKRRKELYEQYAKELGYEDCKFPSYKEHVRWSCSNRAWKQAEYEREAYNDNVWHEFVYYILMPLCPIIVVFVILIT